MGTSTNIRVLTKRMVSLTLLSALCGWSVTPAAEHQHGAVVNEALPEAPEKIEVMKFCTVCHGIERVQHSGGTDLGWEDRIQRMVRWGAQIPQERINAVAAYLAKALPLRPRPAASLSYFANTAVREVTQQDIQRTVRLAAHPTEGGQLRVQVDAETAALLKTGQRARVFSVQARTIMIPATIVSLVRQQRNYEAVLKTTRPVAAAGGAAASYLAEVVIDSGRFLAIPNGAIIDDGDQLRVYVQDAAGEYEPRTVTLGTQGDQVTQVLAGLNPGDQVVTLGSFFIDAERKMNLAN